MRAEISTFNMESSQFNENFTEYLRERNVKEAEEHQSKGKISPTKLTKPTLEAVLQLLGVPTDPPSDQSLRYFIRGNVLEEVVIKALAFRRPTHKLQAPSSYRNTDGYIDFYSKVPEEIKSAGWYTWRKVTKAGQPKNDHCIQATCYALGTDSNTAWIHYINAETFEIRSYRITASDYRPEVDRRIDLILDAIGNGCLPDYVPLEEYHSSIKYSDYSMFFNKTGKEAEAILKKYYDFQYKLLKSKKLLERIT